MLETSSDICSELIADLTNNIIQENTNQVNGMTVLFAAYLKLVSANFYQIVIFSPNDSPPKTMT